MKKYNKLVRDKVVPNLVAQGLSVKWHRASAEEYARALFRKLVEEAQELEAATTVVAQMEEMGDVLDVLSAIKKLFPGQWEDLLIMQTMKRLNKGRFEDRVILDECPPPPEKK